MIPQSGLASVLVFASILLGDQKAIDCKVDNAAAQTYVPFRVIVKTRADSFRGNREALRKAIADKFHTTSGDLAVEEIDDEGTFVVDARKVDITKNLILADFVRDDRFEYIEPDPYIFANTVKPNDPYFDDGSKRTLWGLRRIHAEEAWEREKGSAEIVAAIVDGGINPNHEDLMPLFTVKTAIGKCRKDSVGYDAISDRCETLSRSPHGTQLAGTVGAHGNNGMGVTGVNWVISLLSSTFMENDIGCVATAAAALEYVRQAKDAKAADIRVINLSWTTGEYSETLRKKLEDLSAAGVVLVASAGNDHQDIDANRKYPASYPLPLLVAVGATNQDGDLTGISNFGPKSVHITAPGDDIWTTSTTGNPNSVLNRNNYNRVGGTSIAAAHVTGAVALLASRCPKLTGADLRTLLLENAEPRENLRDRIEGGRFLNVETAMVKAIAKCATLEP